MMPPPSEGNVYHYVPTGTANREQEGVKVAWDAWQTLAGFVLDQSLTDIETMKRIAT